MMMMVFIDLNKSMMLSMYVISTIKSPYKDYPIKIYDGSTIIYENRMENK
jgi:hypothetical protein